MKQTLVCSKRMQKLIEKQYPELTKFMEVVNRPLKKYSYIVENDGIKKPFEITSEGK